MPPNASDWWTDEKVQSAVTSHFVHSHLRPNEAEFLTKAAFGDLSNYTYLEWILTRAQRLFLILQDVGVPDQIFGVVDDSFDDSDLPIAEQDVPALRLSKDFDPQLNRHFYRTQFKYLIRVVEDGEHIRYAKEEIVPVIQTNLKSAFASSHTEKLERVILPSGSTKVFMRKRVSLGAQVSELHVLTEIAECRRLVHPHVLSIFGSYTSGRDIYILLCPPVEHSLKSFLQDMPKPFESLPKNRRRRILLEWPHCLAGGLAWLHENGRHHGCIRPSRIQVDEHFQISFGQFDGDGILGCSEVESDIEAYQYSAPERWKRTVSVQSTGAGRATLPSGGRSARRVTLNAPAAIPRIDSAMRSQKTNSTSPVSPSLSYAFLPTSKRNSTRLRLNAEGSQPIQAKGKVSKSQRTVSEEDVAEGSNHRAHMRRAYTDEDIKHMASSVSSGSGSGRLSRNESSAPVFVTSPEFRTAIVQTWASAQHDIFAADIFSLGAVMMDILTVLCKHTFSSFSRHRSSRNRVAGRGGGLADASFHANIGQVGSWAQMLQKDAEKRVKKDDGALFRAVGPILQAVMQCLEREPANRSIAADLARQLEDHLHDFAGIDEPHCRFTPASSPSAIQQSGSASHPRRHQSASVGSSLGLTATISDDASQVSSARPPSSLVPFIAATNTFSFGFGESSDTAVEERSIMDDFIYPGPESHTDGSVDEESVTPTTNKTEWMDKRTSFLHIDEHDSLPYRQQILPLPYSAPVSKYNEGQISENHLSVTAGDRKPSIGYQNRELPPTPTSARTKSSRRSHKKSQQAHEQSPDNG